MNTFNFYNDMIDEILSNNKGNRDKEGDNEKPLTRVDFKGSSHGQLRIDPKDEKFQLPSENTD